MPGNSHTEGRVIIGMAKNLEVTSMVNRSLNPQNTAALIIHLHAVAVDTMFDSDTFITPAIITDNLRRANTCKAAPLDPRTGKVKYFAEWSLSDMINVAHEANWIDLDVKKFSHALREFRNLIHPYQQMIVKTFPDKDTCEISWLVVQAATNDLARKLK